MTIRLYNEHLTFSAVAHHKNADADAIYSAYLIARTHNLPIIRTTYTPLARYIQSIFPIAPEYVDRADKVLLVDENREENIPVLPSEVVGIIDHHRTGKHSIHPSFSLVYPQTPTTATLLKMLGYDVMMCPMCYALALADDTAFMHIYPKEKEVYQLWQFEWENVLKQVSFDELVDIYDAHVYYDVRVYRGYRIGQIRTYTAKNVDNLIDKEPDILIHSVIENDTTTIYAFNPLFKSIAKKHDILLSRKRHVYPMIEELI